MPLESKFLCARVWSVQYFKRVEKDVLSGGKNEKKKGEISTYRLCSAVSPLNDELARLEILL